MATRDSPAAPRFDWSSKWLKGEEYAYMLQHVSDYSRDYGMSVLPRRTHPSAIYEEPCNGLVYFVKGASVGSEFGFPRVERKKTFRWKKMNFTTELPKRNPVVSYVVATAIKSAGKTSESPLFRMHAVVLTECAAEPHILCHIRSLAEEDTASSTKSDRESAATSSPEPVKRRKTAEKGDGILLLLEAAQRLSSVRFPAPESSLTVDYVSLFRCSPAQKFPLLSTVPKAPFQVTLL